MKFDWKHVVALVLLAVVWLAWGASKAGLIPDLSPYYPIALPVLATVFSWLGLSSPKMPPLLAMFRRRPLGGSGAGATLIALTAATSISTTSCSWLSSPQGAATVTAGIDLAVCVLNHSTEPIQQIVTDCGAATAQDVIRILDAHRAAVTKEKGP